MSGLATRVAQALVVPVLRRLGAEVVVNDDAGPNEAWSCRACGQDISTDETGRRAWQKDQCRQKCDWARIDADPA